MCFFLLLRFLFAFKLECTFVKGCKQASTFHIESFVFTNGFFFTFSTRFQVSNYARTFNDLNCVICMKWSVRMCGSIIINSIRTSFSYTVLLSPLSFQIIASKYFHRLLQKWAFFYTSIALQTLHEWVREKERQSEMENEQDTYSMWQITRLCEKKRVFKCIQFVNKAPSKNSTIHNFTSKIWIKRFNSSYDAMF